MANKMTYVQALENALKVVEGETAERLAALKESIEGRNAKRSSKKTSTNDAFKSVVLQALAEVGKPATVTELLATDLFEENTTNQKVSAILRQMVETDKTVVKTTDKKKSYFALAKTEEEGE